MKHKRELGIFAALLLASILLGAWQAQNFPNGTAGGGLPTGLTFASPTFTVSSAGNGNGQVCLSGNTSGTACLTAPAVAGTVTNPLVSTNQISSPGMVLTSGGPGSNNGVFNASANNITINSLGTQDALFQAGTIELDGKVNDSSGFLMISMTAPTVSSGFGTSPSILNAHNTFSFQVNVGTGGTASTGVIGLPAAHAGWNCSCTDITTNSATVFACKQTGASTTTTAPIGEFTAAGAAQAWAASDILQVSCAPF